MRAIERFHEAIRLQRYRISSHANEEMSEDDLEAVGVEQIILTGSIARRLTRDPRGTRYEIEGETTDGRQGTAVCRFLQSGMLLIITAYAAEE
jgi:Domain of unknown function (DUF4258)